ncbi:MAG: DUF933 domain-containing protein, partial [Acidimicrobiales bacterium]
KQGHLRHDARLIDEADAMEAAIAVLETGTPLYRSGLGSRARSALGSSFLLTDKPVLGVLNVGEDQLEGAEELMRPVREHLGTSAETLAVCVQLEAEAAQLPPVDRSELLEGLGLGDGVVPRVARAAFELLGLSTFLTTGEKETRAWIFTTGSSAKQCAGVIHSDLERGFIRAEVIGATELIELGGWNQAKAAGRLRLEGKEYPVKDGDVLEIRFNV